jgi:hypothetical protein
MKDDIRAVRGTTIKFSLTDAQRGRIEELRAYREDLRRERIGASELAQCAIDPELERVEAELDWVQTDLLWFGTWLEDKASSRRGRPTDPEIRFRNKRIAAHSMLLELAKKQTKAAVATVESLYGVPRSTVFAGRSQWLPHLRAPLRRLSPRDRKLRMKMFEGLLHDWRFQSK